MSKEKSPYNLKALALPVYIPSILFAVAEGSLIPVIPAIAEKFGANLATAAIIVGYLGNFFVAYFCRHSLTAADANWADEKLLV